MRRTVLAAAIVGCLSLPAWAQSDRPDQGHDRAKAGSRGEPSRGVERGPYLGVSATPAPPVLRRHLGLPKGVGLIVDSVAQDSPAIAAGLKPDDVLHKLNDQILVNPQQLAVLVRTLKPGDGVRLSILRDGKPTELSATLAERDVPPLELMRFGSFDLPPGDPRAEWAPPRPDAPGWGPGVMPFDHAHPFPPGLLLNDNASISWDDGKVHMDLSIKAGKTHLVARDKDGKELYAGPVDTDEQVGKLPPEVRERLPQVLPPGHGKSERPKPDGVKADEPRKGDEKVPTTRPANPS